MEWQLVQLAFTFTIGTAIIGWFIKTYRYDGYPSLSDELKEADEEIQKEIKHLKKEMATLKKLIEQAKQEYAEKEE